MSKFLFVEFSSSWRKNEGFLLLTTDSITFGAQAFSVG